MDLTLRCGHWLPKPRFARPIDSISNEVCAALPLMAALQRERSPEDKPFIDPFTARNGRSTYRLPAPCRNVSESTGLLDITAPTSCA